MMEALIELVAASFVRHGIECPASDLPAEEPAALPIYALPLDLKPRIDRAALPERGYRKKPQTGLAT
jgi:hypothetical protein